MFTSPDSHRAGAAINELRAGLNQMIAVTENLAKEAKAAVEPEKINGLAPDPITTVAKIWEIILQAPISPTLADRCLVAMDLAGAVAESNAISRVRSIDDSHTSRLATIAKFWTVILGREISPKAVQLCIDGINLARELQSLRQSESMPSIETQHGCAPGNHQTGVSWPTKPEPCKKGTMGDKILTMLMENPYGVPIEDIAHALGKPPRRIYVWNSTVGKRVGVKFARTGVLTYQPGDSAESQSSHGKNYTGPKS